MVELVERKPLICHNCGGTIDRMTMKCPYCDTQYERKHEGMPVNFVVERPGVNRIRAEVRITEGMKRHDQDAATEFALNKLRHGIADGLLDYMKCETRYDPMTMCHIIRGEVKVIEPEFADYWG